MKVVLIICLLSWNVEAATWYVSATGTSTNGSYSDPWGVQYSVTNINPHMAGGDTVIFKNGGPYICVETNSTYAVGKMLEFRKSGVGSKITYKAESLWGFQFDGGLLVPPTTTNLIIRDFWMTFSGATNRVMNGNYSHPHGIEHFGQEVHLMHNLIDNMGHPAIASWKNSLGKYISGNVIRFTGYVDAGNERGSGMYMQNQDNSPEALIEGNISYFNMTTGMKAYGNTDIWDFRFYRNVAFENNEAGIFYHQDNSGSKGVKYHTNFVWKGLPGLRLGYPLGNGGHTNAAVVGNYVVDTASYPFYQADGWSFNTYSNNVGVRLSDRYVWQMEVTGEVSGDVASHHIDNNTYWGQNSGGFGAGPFFIKEVNKTFAEWQGTVLGDTNSTFTHGTPTNLVTYIFRPSTDTNFVHVVVFNWLTNATTTADLSAYFQPGAGLNIYDAKDIPTIYTNVTYSGTTVTLDLTRTNRAPLLGTFSSRSWLGFDARVRAFVVHQSALVTPSYKTIGNAKFGNGSF